MKIARTLAAAAAALTLSLTGLAAPASALDGPAEWSVKIGPAEWCAYDECSMLTITPPSDTLTDDESSITVTTDLNGSKID